jgi:hypothetical protein
MCCINCSWPADCHVCVPYSCSHCAAAAAAAAGRLRRPTSRASTCTAWCRTASRCPQAPSSSHHTACCRHCTGALQGLCLVQLLLNCNCSMACTINLCLLFMFAYAHAAITEQVGCLPQSFATDPLPCSAAALWLQPWRGLQRRIVRSRMYACLCTYAVEHGHQQHDMECGCMISKAEGCPA